MDKDIPISGDDGAVVKMLAAGLCGSDGKRYAVGGFYGKTESDPDHPIRIGHEGVGRVTSVGSAVKKFKVGDCVTFHPRTSQRNIIGGGGDQGCYAEYLLVRDADISLFNIGANVPREIAALCEPLSVSLGIVDAGKPRAGEKAVVFGAGAIGQGVIAWLKLRGAASVVVVEKIEARRRKALEIGADATLDPAENVCKRLIELQGPTIYPSRTPKPATDIYYDACGVSAAVEEAVACAHRARIIVGGMHYKPVPIDFMAMLLGFNSIQVGGPSPQAFAETARRLTEHPECFAKLLDLTMPFSDIERGLQMVEAQEANGKVVVTFDS